MYQIYETNAFKELLFNQLFFLFTAGCDGGDAGKIACKVKYLLDESLIFFIVK